MSIVITNISESYNEAYSQEGLQHYEVRLNRVLLSEFTHNSEEGMAVCIEKASKSLAGVDIDKCIERDSKETYKELLSFIDRVEGM